MGEDVYNTAWYIKSVRGSSLLSVYIVKHVILFAAVQSREEDRQLMKLCSKVFQISRQQH